MPKQRDPSVRVKRNRDDGKVLYRPATLGWFVEKYLASNVFNADHKDAFAQGTRYNYRKGVDRPHPVRILIRGGISWQSRIRRR
jgi:hypothetical protein